MKKRFSGRAAMLLCAIFIVSTAASFAQDQRGDWALQGADPGQSGWQKDEKGLSPDTVGSKFKFLWKIKLGQPSGAGRSFSDPIMAGRLINAQGFKDIVYWSSGTTLYAVDSELGNLMWKKEYKAGPATAACGVSSLDVMMEPPVVIDFNARRRRAPGTPRPPDPPAAKTTERRLGVAPGGGYFGLRGIYVLSPDGMLHEQVMTTGVDFAPPIKFLPSAGGAAYGLNFANKTVFTETGRNCGGVANGLWAVELSSGNYAVTHLSTDKVKTLSMTGPVMTPDNAALMIMGPGEAAGDAHPESVVSVATGMKVADWFTPEGGMASMKAVSPVTFTYKEKQMVVAPGKDGSVALLDAASLGGADHHTPLSQSDAIAKAGQKHGWDGFAITQDAAGVTWVYASFTAAIEWNGKSDAHGGVVAFKIDEQGGKPALSPVWISDDMVNPAPPATAHGVLVALAQGNTATHAKLYVLNAATGAELYSSKTEIPTYSEMTGVSVGDSHAFFTDHDNVLYSFGIGLEH